MNQTEIINIIANIKAKTSNAEAEIQKLSNVFNKLKLSDKLSKSLENSFKEVFGTLNKYNEKIELFGSGKQTSKDLRDIISLSNELNRSVEKLFLNWDKISEQDLLESLNSSEIKKKQTELSQMSKSIEKEFTELGEATKNIFKNFKTSDAAKGISSMFNENEKKILKSLNIDDFNVSFNEVENVVSKITDKVTDLQAKVSKFNSKDQNNLKILSSKDIQQQITNLGKPIQDLQNQLSQIGTTSKGVTLSERLKRLLDIPDLGEDAKKQINSFIEDISNPSKLSQLSNIEDRINSLKNTIKESGGAGSKKASSSLSQLLNSSTVEQLKQLGIEYNKIIQEIKNNPLDIGLTGSYADKFSKAFEGLLSGDSNSLITFLNNLNNEINQFTTNAANIEGIKRQISALEELRQSLLEIYNISKMSGLTQSKDDIESFKQVVESTVNSALEKFALSFNKVTDEAREAGGAAREAANASNEMANDVLRARGEIENLVSSFIRFTTLEGIVDIFRTSIRSAINDVKELDAAMNSIAVVTEMTTDDLWNQIDTYTDIANTTGSKIAGAYQVAQLYYQQGLNTNEVLTATTETLKLARVASIDYAAATDYMTAAVKGFGLAYTDVTHIMDVYSNLAAKTAADTEEISIAMSKVASIAHSTGMELETTAAFLTQIIATTREAPETAGTALKTIVARFGEVKELIDKGQTSGTDEEGQEVNINKIQGALKLANVALLDSKNQLRDLDDVFIELAGQWDNLDTLTQRYIATQAAGSRQQSRFLALMEDYKGLMETVGYATNAAGANNEQFSKTLESLESKMNGLNNAWTEFTTGITNQTVIKGSVDILTDLLNIVNDITGAFGPVGGSISKVLLLFGSLRLAGGATATTLNKLGLDIEKLGLGGLSLEKVFASSKIINAFKSLSASGNDFVEIAKNVNSKLDATTVASVAASGGLKKFWFVLSGGHPYLLAAIAGITALVSVFDLLTISNKEAAESWENTVDKISENQNAFNEAGNKLQELSDIQNGFIRENEEGELIETDFDTLARGVDKFGNNLSLTSEEYSAYNNLCEQLIDLFPDLQAGYGNATQAISAQKYKLDELLEAKREELKLDQQKAAREINESFTEGNSQRSGITNYDNIFRNNTDSQLLRDIEFMSQVASNKGVEGVERLSYGVYTIKDLQLFIDKSEEIGEAINFTEQQWEDFNQIVQTTKGMIKDIQYDQNEKNTTLKDWLTAGLQETDEWYNVGTGVQSVFQNLINESDIFTFDNLNTVEKQNEFKTALQQLLIGINDDPELQQLQQLFNNLFSPPSDSIESYGQWQTYYNNLMTQIYDILKNSNIKPDLFNALFGTSFTSGQIAGSTYNPNYSGSLTNLNPYVTTNDYETGISTISSGVGAPEDIIRNSLSGLNPSSVSKIIENALNGNIDFNQIKLQGFDEWLEEQFKTDTSALDFDDTLETNFEDMADASRDAWDEIKEIDMSEIFDDGNIDDVEKMSDEYYNYIEALDQLREDYGGVLDEFADTSGLDLSSQGIAQMAAEAQAAGMSLDQFALSKMNANAISILTQSGALSTDAIAAMSAASCYAEAANAKAAYNAGEKYYTTASGIRIGRDQMLSYSNAMAGMGALKTVGSGGGYSGGGSGGGGGGGRQKENDAVAEQDPFYNYIKTVEQYENALEDLQREQDILTDPKTLRENLEAQEAEYQRLIGANQSYLNEVNKQLGIMQQEGIDKWGEYLSFAEDGSLRLNEKYFKSTGDTAEQLDKWIEAYDDVLSRQIDLNEEIDDYKSELKDLWEGWRDGYIDIQEQLVDILIEEDEKALEEKEKYYEKLEQQAEDYLEAVRKNIEEERKARDRANAYEELAQKQRRLALLQRDSSGRYDMEIQGLQEEIAQAQQNLADQQVDDLLSALEEQMNEDQRRHEETLDMMGKQIEEFIENRVYIEEAEQIIAQGNEAILAKLQTSEEYLQASDAQRQQMIDEWGPQIANMNMYIESVNNGIKTAAEYISSMINSGLTQATASIVQAIGTIQPTVIVNGTSYGGGGGGGSGGGGGGTSGGTSNSCRKLCTFTCQGGCKGGCSKTAAGLTSVCRNTCTGSCKGNVTGMKYADGGLVTYTGPAWVDGSPTKPEAFLNPYQTSLIGNFATNLEKLISLNGTSGNSYTGGNCEINIEIGSLGTDYDIDKAINKVKQEIINSTEFRNINIFKRSR